MSAKDNFAQAMKELLNTGDTASAPETEESRAPSSFSSFSMPDSRPPKAPAPEKRESIFAGASLPSEEPDAASSLLSALDEVEEPAAEVVEETVVVEETIESPVAAAAYEAPVAETAPAPSYEAPAAPSYTPYEEPPVSSPAFGEVTVIAAGTTIVGDLNTSGSLTVNGDIKGNIKVAHKLVLNGKIIGDIEAEDAEITSSLVRGNVAVQKNFCMDGGTTVVGDISATCAKSNGKIKGNLTVLERGHFENAATLVGNLVAGTVIIDEGAMLKGDIAITNAQNENIAVDEPEFDIEI